MQADHTSDSMQYFVGGISFGGLLAAHTAASSHRKWGGIVLLAPAIDVETTYLWALQRYLTISWCGSCPLANPLKIILIDLTRDKPAIEEFDADPLNHRGPLKMRLCWAALQGMTALTVESRAAITAPLLILHGAADKVTSPKLSNVFFDQVESKIKAYHALPDQLHLLLHELEKKENARLIFDWIIDGEHPPAE
ncbi:hypothetical protein Ae201684_012740 [Aphanomyces euteiches]|uniref:Serine aminopeptidase S33 domain-containing protein n=1 Tax=Aphanomyces euteiches TaxID=100861 RepID=A0A6G0WQH3_9STRA|nr:hypothetical protein Ae201684_012740 [Aphanomyces euteiches]